MNRFLSLLLITLSPLLISQSISHRSKEQTGQVPENIQRYRDDQKGSIQNRKKGLMDGNRVRTLFQNNGEVSDWYDGAVNAPHLEWPKGTGHRHLDGFTFIAGARVKIIDAAGAPRTITPIETSYREEMDADPVTREIWGFEPIAGYANPSGATPAMSTNKGSYPHSWPAALGLDAGWNGEWNGYFGKGTRDGVLETFYVMDDSRDKEFTLLPNKFFPIASDSSRGGLGLRVEVRGLQFQHQLLEDILFWNYTVTNISDISYDTAAFGMFIDPSVGSVNNNVSLNSSLSMTYLWAPGGKGLPNNYTTGYAGISVFSAPQNPSGQNITSVYVNILGNKGPASVWPKNDNVMWSAMTGGIVDTAITNANISVIVGSPFFNFQKYSSERYDIAMILGSDLANIIFKKKNAKAMYDNKFILTDTMFSIGKLEIISPSMNGTVSGNVNISWSITEAAGPFTSHIFISGGGNVWKYIGTDTSGTNTYQWNSTLFPDGIFYKIAVMSMLENSYGFLYSERTCTVNNPGNAKPEILIRYPAAQSILQKTVNILWTGGDADGEPAVVNLFYKLKSDLQWKNIVSDIESAAGTYAWQTDQIPNSGLNDYLLKAEVISLADTASFISPGFSIVNTGVIKQGDPYIISRKAVGTGKISINVVDPSSITGHQYLITFTPNQGKIVGAAVSDVQTGLTRLSGISPLDGEHESATFDGIRLYIANDTTVAIDSGSGLLPGYKTNAQFSAKVDRSVPPLNKAWAADYRIQFFNTKKDISAFQDPPVFILDSVNFTVTNITNGYPCKFLIQDNDANGIFSPGDSVRIMDGFVDMSNFKLSYVFTYSFKSEDGVPVLPSEGDVFMLRTKRPFIAGDSIIFTTQGLLGVKRHGTGIPASLSLHQNFPNPFNPVTTVQFSVPGEGAVELKIFDILGKEIATVVQERMRAGEYSVSFNGSNLASGTYIMRLQFNGIVVSKKLSLLK